MLGNPRKNGRWQEPLRPTKTVSDSFLSKAPTPAKPASRHEPVSRLDGPQNHKCPCNKSGEILRKVGTTKVPRTLFLISQELLEDTEFRNVQSDPTACWSYTKLTRHGLATAPRARHGRHDKPEREQTQAKDVSFEARSPRKGNMKQKTAEPPNLQTGRPSTLNPDRFGV